jgi:PAS domain S-box-containing protein
MTSLRISPPIGPTDSIDPFDKPNLSLRVFVIEDDADARASLCDVLELDDHRVASAGTAAAALAHPELSRSAVILLDRKLPDATAEGLLPRLKEQAPEAEVIIITGQADLDSAIAALRLGAVDYLLKPINPEALRLELRQLAQRRRAEARAADLGHILENSRNEIYVFDAQTLRFCEVNRGARENVGYSLDELRAMTPLDLKPEFSRESSRESFERLLFPLRGGTQDQIRFETVHRRRDGTLYPVEVHLQRATLDSRVVFLALVTDLTERKRSEQRVLQAERLAAIGKAMTGLAHESRNALQRSQAGLEMLARRLADRPAERELVLRIQKAQEDMHQLFEEVRAYAAPIRLDCKPCDLAELLSAVWDDLAPAREERRARLVRDVGLTDCSCPADCFGLRQVFRNVLENSLAACADPVVIEARFADAALPGGPALAVSLRDNGPGLTPEARDRVFEEFFTTKTRGTGLGMAICRRVVEAHGGRIEVGPGPGAEIVITLPRTPVENGAGA